MSGIESIAVAGPIDEEGRGILTIETDRSHIEAVVEPNGEATDGKHVYRIVDGSYEDDQPDTFEVDREYLWALETRMLDRPGDPSSPDELRRAERILKGATPVVRDV